MKPLPSRYKLTGYDPTPSNEEERHELARVLAAFDSPRHPALVDAEGNRTALPEDIYQLRLREKRMVEKGAVLENALHLLKGSPGLLCLDVELQPWPGCIDQFAGAVGLTGFGIPAPPTRTAAIAQGCCYGSSIVPQKRSLA